MSEESTSEDLEPTPSGQEEGFSEDTAASFGDEPAVVESSDGGTELPDEAGPDAFSQDDLERLVGGPSTVEGVEQIFRSDGERITHDIPEVQEFDFRNPVFLSDKEVNQVRARNEKFAFYLGQNLSKV